MTEAGPAPEPQTVCSQASVHGKAVRMPGGLPGGGEGGPTPKWMQHEETGVESRERRQAVYLGLTAGDGGLATIAWD